MRDVGDVVKVDVEVRSRRTSSDLVIGSHLSNRNTRCLKKDKNDLALEKDTSAITHVCSLHEFEGVLFPLVPVLFALKSVAFLWERSEVVLPQSSTGLHGSTGTAGLEIKRKHENKKYISEKHSFFANFQFTCGLCPLFVLRNVYRVVHISFRVQRQQIEYFYAVILFQTLADFFLKILKLLSDEINQMLEHKQNVINKHEIFGKYLACREKTMG